MTKEQQDLAWKCLPKEVREKIKGFYIDNAFSIEQDESLEWLFGKGNLTSDTEPEEMLTVSRSMIQNKYAYNENILKFDPTHQGAILLKKNFDFLFGDKCLPDKEPLKIDAADSLIAMAKDEMGITDEQPKPKFKVEDLAMVKEGYAKGSVITIKAINIESPISYKSDIKDDGIAQWFLESMLEPYTDEKGKDTEESGNNSEIPNQNKEPMEENKLNLCELLKGCEGEEFFSISVGKVTLKAIYDYDNTHKVRTIQKDAVGNEYNVNFHSDGRRNNAGLQDLYPSEDLLRKYPLDPYSAWMEWKELRKPKSPLLIRINPYIHGELLKGEEKEIEIPVNTMGEVVQALKGLREALQKVQLSIRK